MRVLFSCIPSEGHFSPLLPLARVLAARGHELLFAVAAAWEARVREEGFVAAQAGISQQEGLARAEAERREIFALGAEGRRPQLFTLMFAKVHGPAKLDDLLAAAERVEPDLIVHDSSELAAPIVAAVLGVPVVNHSFGAMIPLPALELAAAELAPLWRRHGLEPDPYAGAFRGLFIDLAPESFAWERPPGRSVRMRPVPGVSGPPPDWLDELEAPLVYATLGTVFNEPRLLRQLLEGLDGVQAVLTVGRDPAELAPVPPRIRVERFVPQAHVLARAAAVVSHGGSGTTLGALAHGLPLVLLPHGADQFDNADRCERAGAAIVLRPGEWDGAALRVAVRRALEDTALAAGARRVAAEIDAMATVEDAADAVEEHAGRR